MRRVEIVLILGACLALSASAASVRYLGRVPESDELIFTLQFVSDRIGFFVSGKAVWRTNDGGMTWSDLRVTPPELGGISMPTAQFLPSGKGWFEWDGGGMLVTDDYGDSWRSLKPVPVSMGFASGLFLLSNGRTGWAGGGEEVRVSPDPKAIYVWRDKPIPHYALTVKDDGMYLLHPVVFVTHNGGQSWTKQSVPRNIGFSVSPIRFLDSNTGIAVADSSIIVTHNGGQTWERSLTWKDLEYWSLDIFLLDHNTAWVSFTNGTLLRTNDGGRRWSSMLSPGGMVVPGLANPVPFPVDMWFWSASNGLAVDDSRQHLFSTSDGGRHWAILFPELKVRWFSALSPTQIWLITDDRRVFRVSL